MMRKNFLRTSVVALLLAVSFTACNSDGLTEVNLNPNAPEVVNSASLFTNATVTGVSTLRGSSFEHGLEALWVQHYSEIQYPEADLNNPRGATVDGLWSIFFSQPLQDYYQILQQSATSPNIAGPTMVMRSLLFQQVTDLWGDVPYTEANRAPAILTPKYDPQEVVYDSIFVALTTAASTMSTTNADVFGSADPIYGSSASAAAQTDHWIRFANSLHARAAMRISKGNNAKAKAEFLKAVAGPVFRNNADNAEMSYPGGTVANPLWLNWADLGGGTRDDQRISKTFVDSLSKSNDPRLEMYVLPTFNSQRAADKLTPCDTVFRGYPNGLNGVKVPNPCASPAANYTLSDFSRPAESIREETSPSILMTYSELQFLMAEAAEYGWVPGSPATYYTAGIRASMEQWGVSATDIAAYLAQPSVTYAGGAAGIRQIAYQKWVALFNQETDAYAEWRRLDYPVLVPGPDVITDKYVPTRLPYSAIESSLNAASLKEATTRQVNVDINGKVWWDK
jgi:hypothetical protein